MTRAQLTHAARSAALFACVLALPACVSTTQYDWGDYPDDLYHYYKGATDDEKRELVAELAQIFARAEEKGARPPPGLYAEYGTFLMQSGDYSGAIAYYAKERRAWPESDKFMGALIDALEKREPSQSVTGELYAQ